LLVALATAVAACSGDDPRDAIPTTTAADATTTSTTAPVPGDEWERVEPEDAGLDAAELEAIAAVAEEGKSHCLTVVRDGKLAGEWYFRDQHERSTQNVFSATKSVASTLVGIAAADGDLDIDDPASTWIREWRGTPSEDVTVRDLLSNVSGRQWSLALDYGDLIRAPDRTGFAIGLAQEHEPGTVWAYNNAAIQTLERVLEEATGEDVAQYARRRLFAPLGMRDTEMTKDSAGNPQVFQGVRSTCRDLARFGVLALNRGAWGGEQIVPAAWFEEATGRSSSRLNAAYGYLWWLNRPGVVSTPLAATDLAAAADPQRAHGQFVPDAPEDMFWALGLGNQVVQVDPGSRTVVVRLGTFEVRPQPPTFGAREASRVVTDAVG
jgi:CubicO group peptidase (beta-lactamase class C family)